MVVVDKQKLAKIFLVLAVGIVAILTRTVGLDWSPPSLSNDEISIAYDAYSVGENGKDEHGNFLPISFQSHNTYKAPLTAYLTIPSIKLLGNNEYGARMPSAILGVLTVGLTGLITFELTKNMWLGIISSLFLAITPWHVYTSRMALESNVALFFLTWGIYLVIKKKWWGYILLGLSVYGYHTEWGLAPMMAVILSLFFYKKIKGVIITMIVATPVFVNFVMFPQNTRAGTQLFDVNKNIIGNILGNYSGYFNLGYLFFDGLDLLPKEDYYQTGLLLAAMAPLFIWGLIKIKEVYKGQYRFLLVWLLISPLIPSLTKGGLVYVRNLVSVVPIILIIAGGYWVIKNWRIKVLTGILIAGSAFYSGVIYYFHFPYQMGINFQYGYKQVATYMKENNSDYKRWVVEQRFGEYLTFSGVPHLYIGYFAKTDPVKMQQREHFEKYWKFDKYEFRDINWNLEKVDQETGYVVPVGNLPERIKYRVVKEIDYPSGVDGFRIIKFD